MGSENEIAEEIKKICSGGEILGADLGAKLRETFPDVNIKDSFGGLYAFIKKYCSEEVIVIGQRGVDLIFANKTSLAPKNAEGPIRGDTLWGVFSNPNSKGNIAVNLLTGEFQICPDIGNLAKDFQSLPKISDQEVKEIATSFLGEIPESMRAEFAGALNLDRYWPKWLQLTKTLPPESFMAWMDFRQGKIVNLFRTRLLKLGSDEAMCSHFSKVLLESKRNRVKTKSKHSPIGNYFEFGDRRILNPYQIAHTLIDQMSEDQLRLLTFPLGTFLKAFPNIR